MEVNSYVTLTYRRGIKNKAEFKNMENKFLKIVKQGNIKINSDKHIECIIPSQSIGHMPEIESIVGCRYVKFAIDPT